MFEGVWRKKPNIWMPEWSIFISLDSLPLFLYLSRKKDSFYISTISLVPRVNVGTTISSKIAPFHLRNNRAESKHLIKMQILNAVCVKQYSETRPRGLAARSAWWLGAGLPSRWSLTKSSCAHKHRHASGRGSRFSGSRWCWWSRSSVYIVYSLYIHVRRISRKVSATVTETF